MSSNEFIVSGKPLSALRVVDLKEELEKRGLSKSGSKKDLYERLKAFLTTEKQRQAVPADDEQLPNISIQQKLADQNPFLRDYFASQAELFHEQKRVQKVYLEEKKRESEASADEGGSSPTKSGGGSPLKSPSQSPSKRTIEQAPPPTMVFANEPPLRAQESPTKSVEIKPHEEPPQENKSPVKPPEIVLEKPVVLQQEKVVSPVKIIPEPEPEPITQERSPRKSARNREPEPPPAEAEPVKQDRSPKKISEREKSPQKVVHADEPPKSTEPEVEQAKTVIKEPSPRRRSSREVTANTTEAVHAEEKSGGEEEGRVRTRRGSQQTRGAALLNNANKTSQPDKVQENNLSEKSIPEEKSEEKTREEVQQAPRRPRGGRAIVFDLKKEEPKPPQKEQVEEVKNESEEKPPESKRIPLRTRAERFKKELSPQRLPSTKVQDENSTAKPVHTELPRKLSSSEESTSVPVKPAPPVSRPRRGGREIVFDIKEEAKPVAVAPAQHKPPPAKRSVAQLSTEELASDDVLDFGDDDKDKKEETPVEVEREPWTPRKINVKNKAPRPENFEEDRSWAKREVKEGHEFATVNPTWQYFKETYYPDLEMINDEDLKLDVQDASFDDGNFGRPFDDIHITRTISNEFAENGDRHGVEMQAEPAKPRKRMISEIIEDEEKELTPSRNPPSEVIKITNLVRPFTLTQLRELLQRTGNVVDLWVDRIKSKCVVKYEEEAHALETRAALHGVTWPASNTKYLRVDFSTTEELDELRNKELSDEKPRIEETNKESSSTVRAWDVGKDGRARRRSRSSSKDKELDRKRARRSSKSPHDERSSRRDRDHASDRDKKEPAKTGKALDELFRKTAATPCIYWLPLTPQQIAEKEELRRQRMLERDRRLAELAQRDQQRDQRYR